MTTTPDHLTPAELQIEARANAATEGPWGMSMWTDSGMVRTHIDGSGAPVSWPAGREPPNGGGVVTYTGHNVSNPKCDAAFIAAARTDVPTLLASLRAERAKVARMEATGRSFVVGHAEVMRRFEGRWIIVALDDLGVRQILEEAGIAHDQLRAGFDTLDAAFAALDGKGTK